MFISDKVTIYRNLMVFRLLVAYTGSVQILILFNSDVSGRKLAS